MGGPRIGPRAGDELERYLAWRREAEHPPLAAWERDKAFLALAVTLWPDDAEGSALGRESNRQRMRLRYEGYRALVDAKGQIQALRDAAATALENWGADVE